MSDPFAKMTPGQPLGSGIGPFNLEWHNAVSDSVRHSIRHKSAGLNQSNIEVLEDAKIWIANVEGVIIPQFTAIGINKLLTFPDDFSDFRNRMCFVTAPLVRNRPFAITQKSIHVNQVFIAKSAIAAGGVQPPAGAWSRLIGDADPFDATAHYAIGEQVTYGGETYAAILPADGQATSDTTYWIPLGSRRGLWDGASYAAGEIVAVPSLGEILISGISRLLLFISHPRHLYAGVSELGISTQEEPGPLEVIWKEGGTGERWAIVRFCCDAFGLQVCAGVGALVFGPLELSASGIRYGGDFTVGVATLAGSGTSTPPIYTGTGAGSLPALTLAGSGSVYDPTPSGNLYFGVTALAGTGTVVNPPSGFAFIQFGALALDGTGTNTPPTCTGTGALTFGAIIAVGVGGGCCGITSLNGQTGPAVTLASLANTVIITQSVDINDDPIPNSLNFESVGIKSINGETGPGVIISTSNLIIGNPTDNNISIDLSFGITKGQGDVYVGTGFIAIPSWDSLVTYLAGWVIVHDGIYYQSLGGSNTNITPPDGAYWVVLPDMSKVFIINIPDASRTDVGLLTVGLQQIQGPKDITGYIAASEYGSGLGDGTAQISYYGIPFYEARFRNTRPTYYSGGGYLNFSVDDSVINDLGSGSSVLKQSAYFTLSGFVDTEPGNQPSQALFQPTIRLKDVDGTWYGQYQTALGLEFRSGLLVQGSIPSVSGSDLATGFVLPAANAGNVFSSENKQGATVDAGMIVATHSSGTGFVLADASSATLLATGITRASIANTVYGDVQTTGLIVLADWTASTGGATLTATATYYSDPANPGKMTTTMPTTDGYVVQVIGKAVSTDTMDLAFSDPILL